MSSNALKSCLKVAELEKCDWILELPQKRDFCASAGAVSTLSLLWISLLELTLQTSNLKPLV